MPVVVQRECALSVELYLRVCCRRIDLDFYSIRRARTSFTQGRLRQVLLNGLLFTVLPLSLVFCAKSKIGTPVTPALPVAHETRVRQSDAGLPNF